MVKFQNGDFIVVVDINKQCDAKLSTEWVQKYAPEYWDLLKPISSVSEEDTNAYRIINTRPVLGPDYECLVQNLYSQNCYLVYASGLKLKYNKISKNDSVRVTDLTFVYTKYSAWIKKNAPEYLKYYNTDKIWPNRDNNYNVVAVAPKADFEPLNKENLVLILNPKTANAFLVEEKGLWLCEEENINV
ncbi:MAG: hypothetical protein ACI37Z_05055 [Candidatus Gastranaerophilaceae bacterium]